MFVQRVEGPDGRPAAAAVGPPGAGHLVVFSSLESLAGFAGECDWASASGADVLALVPGGYGVVVDPGAAWTAVLPAAAIEARVVVGVSGPP